MMAIHLVLAPAHINKRDWLNLPVESRLLIRAGGIIFLLFLSLILTLPLSFFPLIFPSHLSLSFVPLIHTFFSFHSLSISDDICPSYRVCGAF